MVSGRVQSMDGGTWPAPSCGLKAAKVRHELRDRSGRRDNGDLCADTCWDLMSTICRRT